MTPGDFHKACQDLNLIPDVIANEPVVNALYAEIDTANTKKVTMDQVDAYIKRVSNFADVKGIQDEVLTEIATRVKQNKINLENILRKEDPTDRARIPEQSFLIIIRSQLQIKEVDAKVISLRYQDTNRAQTLSPEVNYKQFVSQL